MDGGRWIAVSPRCSGRRYLHPRKEGEPIPSLTVSRNFNEEKSALSHTVLSPSPTSRSASVTSDCRRNMILIIQKDIVQWYYRV
ncbi:hypothetical protein F3Y22_tig00112498pilonHSYRG00317 [Hibiscus syriacus]|uniref:Uncharacterized protein n=1 Tax=Hibiscus syriacus TaxID=106335 RepID=A0A6A2XWS7_HIBSY|nr:hypothetical protein F3Y22_tig00112498pilonHSYRG00317 [Hibiscus syriacus]